MNSALRAHTRFRIPCCGLRTGAVKSSGTDQACYASCFSVPRKVGNLKTCRDEKGFTIVEVIVTLIIAAILGTLLIQFMGSNLSASAVSVVRVQKGFDLRQVMENITRDYRDWLNRYPDDTLADFKTDFVDTYATSEISIQTNYNEVDSGHDGDIEILQVTISDGTQRFAALFTK